MTRPRKKDRHLPECVYPKHGAYWYVKNGKWQRLPPTGPSTLSSALEAYAALVETPRGGMPALIDEALVVICKRVAPSTAGQYEDAAKILKRKLVQFAPAQVRPVHVVQLRQSLVATPNMANRCLSVLRSVFDYALEQQLIDSNPAIGVKRLKEKKRDRLITPQEYVAIYAQAGPRLQVIMDLCIRTGQRITAVLRIRRADLTEEGIRFGRHKTEGKGVTAWTPELRAVVERAKTLDGKISALTLLRNRRGKPPDYRTVRDQWDEAVRAAGVSDAHLHDLRAVAATWAKRQGLNPTALLMHSSPAQTERYLRGREEPVIEGPSFGHLIDGTKKTS